MGGGRLRDKAKSEPWHCSAGTASFIKHQPMPRGETGDRGKLRMHFIGRFLQFLIWKSNAPCPSILTEKRKHAFWGRLSLLANTEKKGRHTSGSWGWRGGDRGPHPPLLQVLGEFAEHLLVHPHHAPFLPRVLVVCLPGGGVLRDSPARAPRPSMGAAPQNSLGLKEPRDYSRATGCPLGGWGRPRLDLQLLCCLSTGEQTPDSKAKPPPLLKVASPPKKKQPEKLQKKRDETQRPGLGHDADYP